MTIIDDEPTAAGIEEMIQDIADQEGKIYCEGRSELFFFLHATIYDVMIFQNSSE